MTDDPYNPDHPQQREIERLRHSNEKAEARIRDLEAALRDLLNVIEADALIPESVSYMRKAREAIAATAPPDSEPAEPEQGEPNDYRCAKCGLKASRHSVDIDEPGAGTQLLCTEPKHPDSKPAPTPDGGEGALEKHADRFTTEELRQEAPRIFDSLVQDGMAIGLGQLDYTDPEVSESVNRKVHIIRRALSAGVPKYRANFLWPHEDETPEAHGYEFANANTEEYAEQRWELLKNSLSAGVPEAFRYECKQVANLLADPENHNPQVRDGSIQEAVDRLRALAQSEQGRVFLRVMEGPRRERREPEQDEATTRAEAVAQRRADGYDSEPAESFGGDMLSETFERVRRRDDLERDIKQAASLVDRGHTDLALHVLRQQVCTLSAGVPEAVRRLPEQMEKVRDEDLHSDPWILGATTMIREVKRALAQSEQGWLPEVTQAMVDEINRKEGWSGFTLEDLQDIRDAMLAAALLPQDGGSDG